MTFDVLTMALLLVGAAGGWIVSDLIDTAAIALRSRRRRRRLR